MGQAFSLYCAVKISVWKKIIVDFISKSLLENVNCFFHIYKLIDYVLACRGVSAICLLPVGIHHIYPIV